MNAELRFYVYLMAAIVIFMSLSVETFSGVVAIMLMMFITLFWAFATVLEDV